MRPATIVTYIAFAALLVVTTSVMTVAATAAQPADASKVKVVDLSLRDVSVKDAIAELFRGTGLKYSVQPGVSGKVVELKLKGVTFKQGLDALAEAARFSYTVRDGVYVISPKSGAASTAAPVATQPPSTTATAQTGAGTGSQPAPPTVTAGAPNVVVNNQQSPVFYGNPAPPPYYPPYGFGGDMPFYQYGNVRILGGYPPVVVAGGNPYIIRNAAPVPPPPPGYVSPEVLRFLRGQWAIRSHTIITPY